MISLPFIKDKRPYINWWKRAWCKTACKILGVHLFVKFEQEPLPGNYLAVSNHLSFMDPVMSLAVLKGMPVAKAEIANYPLIGYAAKRTGIIWVERENVASRTAAKNAVENALKKGQSVLVYAEGTISYSPTELRPFKKGAFDGAITAEVPVLYCAIYYESEKAYWKEENSLTQQLFEHFSVWQQNVHIHISQAHYAQNPAQGAINARDWIQNQLNLIAEAAINE